VARIGNFKQHSSNERCRPLCLQSVMLVELDGARRRTVGLQLVGSTAGSGSTNEG
jgi:hypothetical protein